TSSVDLTRPARQDRESFVNFEQGGSVHVTFLGKDSDSFEGDSPTLFATDRTDRKTYIAQGWVVTDPQALAEIGPVPAGEAIIEIREDALKFYR
ncbi:MAG: hypothetical protein ACRDSH_07055, partial [Pseudonocardiaceae bacterium]